MGYTSYKDKVLKVLKDNKHEFCEKVGVLCVGEAQSISPKKTGNLIRSITHEVMQKDVGVYIGVTPSAPYGVFLEKGTSKIEARPYLEPGVMNAIPKIKDVAEDLYRRLGN